MKHVTLGRDGPQSSRLIYGVMRVLHTWFPNEVTDDARAQGLRSIQAAYEAGYTHFDNADIYCRGECERLFGEALRQTQGMRQRIAITTKCGVRFENDPQGEPKSFDQTREHITWSCEQSLQRMGVDCIDLYLLHRPDWLMPAEDVAAAFDALHKAGKVKHFGVSNFAMAQLDVLRQVCDQPLVANQIMIHPGMVPLWESGTLWELMARGITPVAWGPVNNGLFAGESQPKADHPQREMLSRVIEALDTIARRDNISRTVACLGWLMRHPAGIVPVIGSTQPDRIRDAALADDYEMSRGDWYRVLKAIRGRDVP